MQKPAMPAVALTSFISLLLAASLSLFQPAHSAIDMGAAPAGDGELFFNIWDYARSYSRDLDISINTFETRLAEAGPVALSWPADSTFAKFLAGVADVSELRWNVVAVDGIGARRVLATFTPPRSATPPDDPAGRRMASALQFKINSINLGLNGAGDYLNPADDAQSSIFRADNAGYAGDNKSLGMRLSDKLDFDSTGKLANNSAATGLGFLRVDSKSFGMNTSMLYEYSDMASPIKVWLDATHTLHIGVSAPTKAK